MPRYKYPAPFDPPDPGPVQVVGAPEPPAPPVYSGPPLPVDIPVEKIRAERRRSLYKDLFGTDLSVVAEAYAAPWASHEQRELASQILDGQKSIHTLSTAELELLDDLAVRFNDQGGELNESMRAAHRERLPVPEHEGARGQEAEEMQPAGESDLQPDLPPDVAGAYGWLRGDGGEESSE